MASADRNFRPTASLANLRLRGELLRKTREFFDSRGFLEVETPLLSADTVVDRHLDPIPVTLADDPRRPDIGRRMWLQTSPEFGMKRLVAAGLGAIYQITRAFRNAEIGPLHNPEFTMVEWYRASDRMRDGMQLLSDLCE
ncbi:MAG TPA: amino acid--tRNA ligase-related protein, partial [Pirellulales bacterium]